MSLTIQFGNVRPHQLYNPHRPGTMQDLGITAAGPGDTIALDPLISNTTTVVLPDDVLDASQISLREIANTVEHLWAHHSGASPSWITFTPNLITLSTEHLAEIQRKVRDRLGMPPVLTVPTALVTNAGLDYASLQLGGTASATAIAKYIALTANSSAAGATDTTLTAEITTASGGLIRAAATYAHTGAASTYTQSKTFTANGSDTLPVTVAKAGLFDTAVSGGNMAIETLVSPTVTFTASGDNSPLTWTITV